MATLYELNNTYQYLLNMDLDEETLQDTLDSINFQDDLENKVDGYCRVLRELEAEEEKFSAEIKRLQEAKKRITTRKEKLKTNLQENLISMNALKVNAGTFALSFRKSKKVEIENETLLAEKFFKVKKEVNKTELAKALKAGEEVAGASLVESMNLQIK